MMRQKISMRWVSTLLSCLMLVCLMSSPVFAANDTTTATANNDNALSQLLKVLQNDKQRAALISALEKSQSTSSQSSTQSTTEKSSTSTTASTSSETSSVVDGGGLLGAVTSGIDWLQDGLSSDHHSMKGFSTTAVKARQDWSTMKQKVAAESARTSVHFILSVFIWLAVSVVLLVIGRTLQNWIGKSQWTEKYVKLSQVIRHWLYVPIPIIAGAFLSWYITTLFFGHQDIGHIFGLVLGFTLTGGCIFTSLWTSLVILANGTHRQIASRILIKRGYYPCLLIASAAGLGESLNHSPLTPIMGNTLSHLVGIFFSVVACICVIPFTFTFRRAINQVLFNRSLAHRHIRSQSFTISLRVFKRLWPVCIVIMTLVGVYQLIMGLDRDNDVLTRMIGTMILIVAGLILIALVRQLLVPNENNVQRELVSRLRQLLSLIASIFIMVQFFQFITLVWGGSFYHFIHESTVGQLFGHAVFSIIGMLVVALAIWISLDALIDKLMESDKAKSSDNLRLRTILPLLRNAAKIVLSVITIITILANIGINIAPLIAGAGVVGLAVGFGAQQLVHDVITGIFNILENTMSIGDYINLNGIAGTVEGMSIRTVRMRDTNGALISIPFSQVNTVKNLSRKFANAVVTVNFTLDSNVDHLLKIFEETADEIAQDFNYSQYILSPFVNYGLEQVTQNGYLVGGKFMATTAGYSTVQYAFYKLLAQKVEVTEDVSFSRAYQGGKDMPVSIIPQPQNEAETPAEGESTASKGSGSDESQN